ncbi:MAG: hypothetical protein IAG10_13695 [Planctomycetaceae bacterium]|nr:hypothetical protein [Planctomycetaceae bacterium]
MLGQPIPPTAYDLRFSVFGIPVRVTPYFWLTAAILSWREGQFDKTLLGILCVFVSILIHELGHAVVTRRLGWRPEIVLEMFGGYATTRSHSRWGNVAVAAAGPAAGLLLFALLRGLLHTSARHSIAGSDILKFVVGDLLVLNWGWSLMNLIPVLPLDGGQIARELIGMRRPYEDASLAHRLSIAVAAGVAIVALVNPPLIEGLLLLDSKFFAFFFAYLAFLNYQSLQPMNRSPW